MNLAKRLMIQTLAVLSIIVPTCTELGNCTTARADDKSTISAQVTATEPAVIVSGTKVSLKVRGFRLKEATELRLPKAAQAKAEITEKKDAAQPKGLENQFVGDTQLLTEITLPTDQPIGFLDYVIATPAGEATGKILVISPDSIIDEVEPNNGFREAQKLQYGKSARGSIQGDKDVDVYSYPIVGGKKYKVKVISGGPLIFDAELDCFDAEGQHIASADDELTRDPVLTLQSPMDSIALLCVSSVHDIGGEWHSYILTVEEWK